jgi:murein L,D-transpeptidase YcbB/YkuD
MTTTTLKKELNTYLPLLSARQQALILDMIKNILHVDSKEKRISVEQYNAEIESALKEVRQGKGIPHDEVIKQSRRWLKRK